MQVVINIMKLSSLSIANKMSFQTAETSLATRTPPVPSSMNRFRAAINPSVAQFSGSLRSQEEPQKGSKPISYILDPVEGNKSMYVIREKKSIHGQASDYIKKVYEKICQ